MAQSVDELTFEYRDEEGTLLRRELDKVVLSKGAWATIMYLYQDLDRGTGTYKAPKVAIVRYRKSRGVYRKQTSFNISSERQGRMIMEVLERWYATADQLAGGRAEGAPAAVPEAGESAQDSSVQPASPQPASPESPLPEGQSLDTDAGLSGEVRSTPASDDVGSTEAAPNPAATTSAATTSADAPPSSSETHADEAPSDSPETMSPTRPETTSGAQTPPAAADSESAPTPEPPPRGPVF